MVDHSTKTHDKDAIISQSPEKKAETCLNFLQSGPDQLDTIALRSSARNCEENKECTYEIDKTSSFNIPIDDPTEKSRVQEEPDSAPSQQANVNHSGITDSEMAPNQFREVSMPQLPDRECPESPPSLLAHLDKPNTVGPEILQCSSETLRVVSNSTVDLRELHTLKISQYDARSKPQSPERNNELTISDVKQCLSAEPDSNQPEIITPQNPLAEIIMNEPPSMNETTINRVLKSQLDSSTMVPCENGGDKSGPGAQIPRGDGEGSPVFLQINLDPSRMVTVQSSGTDIEKNHLFGQVGDEVETVSSPHPIDDNIKQQQAIEGESADIPPFRPIQSESAAPEILLVQSIEKERSPGKRGFPSTAIQPSQMHTSDVIDSGRYQDFLSERMQEEVKEQDDTNVILDIILNRAEKDEQYQEPYSPEENYPRRSLEEIIDIQLTAMEHNYPTTNNHSKTTSEIMNSLDDPELNESLEDEPFKDESIVASSSFETSAYMDSRLFPHLELPDSLEGDNENHPRSVSNLGNYQLSSTQTDEEFNNHKDTEEPEIDEEFQDDGHDSTWNLTRESGNNSTLITHGGKETEDSVTGDESSLNITDQLEIPNIVGAMDDKDLWVQPSTNKYKQNFCFYCKKMQSVISQHLETVHKNESPVKKFSVFPKGNPERRKIIETLRLKGNYLYNTQQVHNKTGELLVSRRPKEERSATLYKICHNCTGVFSAKTIRRHRQSCLGASTRGERSNVILSRRIEGRLHESANDRLARVMAVLREDDIVRLVRYDELLIKFGNCLCEKYYKQQQEEMIRNRLRTLGRLLQTMKEINPDITDFKSIYQPKRYEIMLDAVRKLSGFDPLTGVHQIPSLVTSIGTYIKAVSDLLKLHWVENLDEEKEKIFDKFLFLHTMQYSQVVNRVPREDQSQKHRQQVKPLPTTSDIKKLTDYVNNKMITAYASLNEQYSYQYWLSLLQFTLISIQIFNRRRAGEIERASTADLNALERISETTHPEIYEKLSATQKSLAGKYARFIITGKLGRDVSVLLNSQMEKSLNLLLKHRSSTKIPAKNPYIFGIRGFTDGRFKYLRACQLLRQFAEECGAEHPDRLRGTYLRKHVATTCAEENMDENNITDIANFMGHAEAIHRSHYRRSVVSRDVLGVVNILCKAQGDGRIPEHQSNHGASTSTVQQQQANEDKSDDNSSENVNSNEIPSTSSMPLSPPTGVSNTNDNRATKRRRVIYSSSEDSSTDESIIPDQIQPIKRNVTATGIQRTNNANEKKRKLRWSDEEKTAAFAAFGSLIKSNRLPATTDIRKFLPANPSITRTVNQIRTWASNEKKKCNADYRD
ncbi:uncharacterized protein LOC135171197 [Diachasmimorpha longicaudata]|uniref:uncharacterized protein LOC135171197 n=1 Tax=Diachasmimorpha longicaudata TaxID=58733 RepID=UPI0030B88FAB